MTLRRLALVATVLAGFLTGSVPWGCRDRCDLPEPPPDASPGRFRVLAADDPDLVGAVAELRNEDFSTQLLVFEYTVDETAVEVRYWRTRLDD